MRTCRVTWLFAEPKHLLAAWNQKYYREQEAFLCLPAYSVSVSLVNSFSVMKDLQEEKEPCMKGKMSCWKQPIFFPPFEEQQNSRSIVTQDFHFRPQTALCVEWALNHKSSQSTMNKPNSKGAMPFYLSQPNKAILLEIYRLKYIKTKFISFFTAWVLLSSEFWSIRRDHYGSCYALRNKTETPNYALWSRMIKNEGMQEKIPLNVQEDRQQGKWQDQNLNFIKLYSSNTCSWRILGSARNKPT